MGLQVRPAVRHLHPSWDLSDIQTISNTLGPRPIYKHVLPLSRNLPMYVPRFSLHRHSQLLTCLSDLRHPIVTTLLHLHASLLLPLFHHLWLTQGTGNANFFYASTLVFGVSNGAALIDSIYAGLRIAIGKGKEGFEVVQE